jgi:hypothetical protein
MSKLSTYASIEIHFSNMLVNIIDSFVKLIIIYFKSLS